MLYRKHKMYNYCYNIIEKTILSDNLIEESFSTLSVVFGISEEEINKILLERAKNEKITSKN